MALDLTQLLHLSEEMSAYRGLLSEIEQGNGSVRAAVLDAAKPYLIAAIRQHLQRPTMVITAQPENSRKLYEQLSTWCTSNRVELLPEPDALPYERIASNDSSELERLQVLSALAGIAEADNLPTEIPPLIVTSAPAFMQKVAPFGDFTAASHTIRSGMEIEPFQLLGRWQAIGYRLEDMVEVPGTMSHRGGIIDIYPPTSDLPARLEFFGNTVESIRLFDPADQRSLRPLSSIAVGPATELLTPGLNSESDLEAVLRDIDLTSLNHEVRQQLEQEKAMLLNGERPSNGQFYAPLFHHDSILSYLPKDALIILDEPQSIEQEMADLDAKADELRTEKSERGELPPNFPRPYFTWEELESPIKSTQCLTLTAWGATRDEKWHELSFAPTPSYAGQLPALVKKVKEMLGQRKRLILVSHQASRLSELLEEEDIIAPPLNEIKEVPPPGSLTLVQGLLDGGWVMNGDTYLLTDAEIFGFI